jgi:hypothetical protein
MVGYAFMGAAHSQAWRTAGRVFDLPLSPLMVALCGREAAAAGRAAATLGWQSSVPGWEELVERPDIDVIDICTPGDTHAQIAIAALDACKHVLCENPLGNSVDDAEAMTASRGPGRRRRCQRRLRTFNKVIARRKNRRAAAASRRAASTSMSWPCWSTALYTYRQTPLTSM